ncbi:MAG: glycosyltransferase [Phycisphaerae bacterium]|nr:glycosyltransferase [Phycisphaerae bacterium]
MIVTVAGGLVGLEWIARNIFALRAWRNAFHLTEDFSQPAEALPKLSVVVAAKDEEANIASCVKSLLGQDYPNLELIVVDDRSEDKTAEIVRQIAAGDSRLKLLQITELPEGWCGKNHAMQNGLAKITSDWLCMTDADCTFDSPKTLSLAMEFALHKQTDMLSLLPTLTMGGFWERFLLPICGGVLMIWFPPHRVNNPKRPEAYANGMFMLMRREAYQAIGTHEAIKGSLIEDMDLARKIKTSGRNLQTVPTVGLFSVRMYTSLEQIQRGWVRIFVGSFQNLWRLLKALGVLTGRGLTPFVTMAIGWAMVLAGVGPQQWWQACAAVGSVGLAAQLVMTSRFYHHAGSSWWLGLLYPIGCGWVACLLIKTMAALRSGAKIVWRNTTYDTN